MTDPAFIAADLRAECEARHANCDAERPCVFLRAAAALERVGELPAKWRAKAWTIERDVQFGSEDAGLTDPASIAIDDCADALEAALAPPAQEESR
jgi:hypothetical protein